MAQSISINAYEFNGYPRNRTPVGVGVSSQSRFVPYNGNDTRLYGLVTDPTGNSYATVESVSQLIAKANQ